MDILVNTFEKKIAIRGIVSSVISFGKGSNAFCETIILYALPESNAPVKTLMN